MLARPIVHSFAIILSWPGSADERFHLGQLENAYGFLGLLGFVTLAIIGMLYKIVPFLVWFRWYSGRIGREAVYRRLRKCYSPPAERLGIGSIWLGCL